MSHILKDPKETIKRKHQLFKGTEFAGHARWSKSIHCTRSTKRFICNLKNAPSRILSFYVFVILNLICKLFLNACHFRRKASTTSWETFSSMGRSKSFMDVSNITKSNITDTYVTDSMITDTHCFTQDRT